MGEGRLTLGRTVTRGRRSGVVRRFVRLVDEARSGSAVGFLCRYDEFAEKAATHHDR